MSFRIRQCRSDGQATTAIHAISEAGPLLGPNRAPLPPANNGCGGVGHQRLWDPTNPLRRRLTPMTSSTPQRDTTGWPRAAATGLWATHGSYNELDASAPSPPPSLSHPSPFLTPPIEQTRRDAGSRRPTPHRDGARPRGRPSGGIVHPQAIGGPSIAAVVIMPVGRTRARARVH